MTRWLHHGLRLAKNIDQRESARRLSDREQQELLAHDVKQLQSKSLLETALDYIAQKRRELEAQIDQLDRDMQDVIDQRLDLQNQVRFLDEQRQQLLDEAAAERRR
jgi:hypothetical protein